MSTTTIRQRETQTGHRIVRCLEGRGRRIVWDIISVPSNNRPICVTDEETQLEYIDTAMYQLDIFFVLMRGCTPDL